MWMKFRAIMFVLIKTAYKLLVIVESKAQKLKKANDCLIKSYDIGLKIKYTFISSVININTHQWFQI